MLRTNYDKMIEGTEVAFNSLNQLLTDTYDSRNQNISDPGLDFEQVLTKITEVKDTFRNKLESMQGSLQSLPNQNPPTSIGHPPQAITSSIQFPEDFCQSPGLPPQPQSQSLQGYDNYPRILHLCPREPHETPGFNSRGRELTINGEFIATNGELIATINSRHQESTDCLEGLYTLGSKSYNSTEHEIIRDEDVIPSRTEHNIIRDEDVIPSRTEHEIIRDEDVIPVTITSKDPVNFFLSLK